MSVSGESGRDQVRDEQYRQFVDAIKLIEPFCGEGILPEIKTYEIVIDVQEEGQPFVGQMTVEVSIDRMNADYLEMEGVPPSVDYGLSIWEHSTNEGRLRVARKAYNVFAFKKDDDEVFEPLQDDTYYVEDENGKMVRQLSPIDEAYVKAHEMHKAGDEAGAQKAHQEASRLFAQHVALEQIIGTENYTLQRHIAAMAIIHKIHEKLGIESE